MARFSSSKFYSRLTGHEKKNLSSYDLTQLRAIAKNYGITGYSRLKKEDIIDVIRFNPTYIKSTPKKRKEPRAKSVKEAQELIDLYDEEEDYIEDTTIEQRIREKAIGKPNTDEDWYASQLYSELELVAEQRLPSIGEFCFFSYSAAYPDRYKYYDQRPLTYILEYQEDKILGANVHYLNPSYRDSVATSLLNKGGAAYVPKKTLHSYFISNMDNLFIIPDRDLEGIARLVTERFVDRDGVKVELQMVWDS